MLKKERQAYILDQLSVQKRVLSTDLSQVINVSDDTIRRDLHELAAANKLVKVHGGALSFSSNNYFDTGGSALAKQKQVIARKAVSLLVDGMFVLTAGNSIVIEFARHLPVDLHATFISGSIPVVFEYLSYPNIDVIVIGDKLSRKSKLTTGANALSQIRQINADICFLGVNAIDINNGITGKDWEAVQIKKAMVKSSRKVVCLAFAEKINTVQPLQVCDCRKIDVLITELPPTDKVLKPYLDAGIQVM